MWPVLGATAVGLVGSVLVHCFDRLTLALQYWHWSGSAYGSSISKLVRGRVTAIRLHCLNMSFMCAVFARRDGTSAERAGAAGTQAVADGSRCRHQIGFLLLYIAVSHVTNGSQWLPGL